MHLFAMIHRSFISAWDNVVYILPGMPLMPVFFQLIIILSISISLYSSEKYNPPFIVVLGIAQDAGYPHIGCKKRCCEDVRSGKLSRRSVSCLAVVDPVSNERWLFDATPDITTQLHLLDSIAPLHSSASNPIGIDGIFLTHAHIGHYTGLMYLGREGMGAKNISVYAMPRMHDFLKTNGPWSQLVELKNIELHLLAEDQPIALNERITVTPLRVPHRDEFSETVGFIITSMKKSALFIPDIDKWERWDRRIEEYLSKVDVAFLDGTFFDEEELPGRSMSEIPHPFIVESMKRLSSLPPSEKSKIKFIHLNHTNPALDPSSNARKTVREAGFENAEEGERIIL